MADYYSDDVIEAANQPPKTFSFGAAELYGAAVKNDNRQVVRMRGAALLCK